MMTDAAISNAKRDGHVTHEPTILPSMVSQIVCFGKRSSDGNVRVNAPLSVTNGK